MIEHQTLAEAMEAVKAEREAEIGVHTWKLLVEHYGEAILFAEIASIVSRLEGIFWKENIYRNPDDLTVLDRALDLCVDLGNYTDFLYRTLLERVHVAKIAQEDFQKLTQKESGRHEEAR